MEPSNSSSEAPSALFRKRGARNKTNIRKRPVTPPTTSQDRSSSDHSSSENEPSQSIKRRRRTDGDRVATFSDPNSSAEVSSTVYKADRSVLITDTNDATKRSNWFDAEEPKGAAQRKPGDADGVATPAPDGLYKGMANKSSFVQRNPNAPTRTVGPVKAPTNIRTITVTDFAPDVCKDYKQTGFCGFGDNCKYLHAREDYKAGWQLDREWESVTKGKKNLAAAVVANAASRGEAAEAADDNDEDDTLLDSIPFACIICRGSYKAPIVTRCGHYFCEGCALKRYRRDPNCAACGTGTNGVFNSARRLQKLLDKKRERSAKRRQAALAAGEDVSDEEEAHGFQGNEIR